MSGTPGSSGFSSSCGPIHVLVPDFLATAPHYCLSVALSMCKEGFMCWYWANHTIEAYPCYHYVFIYFAGLGIKSRSLQMIIKYLATELFPSPPSLQGLPRTTVPSSLPYTINNDRLKSPAP